MSAAPPETDRALTSATRPWTECWPGWLVLCAGWILPQILLLGSSLVGRTVYAPVDLLARPNILIPRDPDAAPLVARNRTLSDLIYVAVETREFATKEFSAGRLPVWQPANFAGAPFATWPKYSPFELLTYLAPWPASLAWGQLLQVLTYGVGTWVFLRRVLGLSYWPAAIAAWCAPLTGFLSLWQGFPVVPPVCWLPWSLIAVRQAIAAPGKWSNVGQAVVTALILLSGQVDVGGLVLLTTGLYAVWLLIQERLAGRNWQSLGCSVTGISAAWLLGILLATPYLLPLVAYVKTGARMQSRSEGAEERPPIGWSALPAVALPEIYGNLRRGSLRLASDNNLESSATAYAGLLAALWIAPLAWCHAKLRRESAFLLLLALAGLAWTLNIPGVVNLMRLAPLNMLSYNRWAFATCWAILVLTAIGLEMLFSGPFPVRRWFFVPMTIVAAFGIWCVWRSAFLPEPLRTELEAGIVNGLEKTLTLEYLNAVRKTFKRCYESGAAMSFIALIGWVSTLGASDRALRCRRVAAILLPIELLSFSIRESRDRQADRALFFPRVAALETLAKQAEGRIWGVMCLPPNLNQTQNLEEIRGYDGVDPADFLKLFNLATDPEFVGEREAATFNAMPLWIVDENGQRRLHPVADLLNVRHLVYRRPPPEDVTISIHEEDYWVVENARALPRAFVPKSVRVAPQLQEALDLLGRSEFDPKKLAVLHQPLAVPKEMAGTVSIHHETPARVRLDAEMTTDGLVVVSELWDAGWRAELDGTACPIHRVNVALRGIRIPAGSHTVVMTYVPVGLREGMILCGVSAVALLVWTLLLVVRSHGHRATA